MRSKVEIEADIVNIVHEPRMCGCRSIGVVDEVRLYCGHENDRVSALLSELRAVPSQPETGA